MTKGDDASGSTPTPTEVTSKGEESRFDYVAALDHMFEGLQIIDRDYRYLYVNETAAVHGRRPKAELVGRTMQTCFPGIEDTAMFARLRLAMEGEPQRLDNEFVYADGTSCWFELHVQPIPEGILILSHDITERKVRERELARSREEMAAILDCLADAVLTLDEHGRITRMNPAAEKLLECDRVEALGHLLGHWASFVDTRGRTPVRFGVGNATTSGKVVELQRIDGTELPVVASEAPLLDPSGSAAGVVIALRDISQEQSLQAQLRQAQKMEAVGRLAAGVAHDFNNVLTAILSFSQFAREGLEHGSQASQDLDEVMLAAQRAVSLTRHLLTFSRQRTVQPLVIDVNELLVHLERLLRRLLSADVALELRLGNDPWPVFVDPGALEQVVVNLMVNARDAMPTGGVVTLSTANIALRAPLKGADGAPIPPGDYLSVAVIDDGIGMSDDMIEHVFDPFFTTKRAEKGTGLGLSTCYGIVRQASGFIAVTSERGFGSKFEIFLPRCHDPLSDPPRAPERADTATAGGACVLVAEDDDMVRKMVVRTLRRAGYTVLAARDADEALATLQASPGEIDALVSDVVMPSGSGILLAQRAMDTWRIPTLFMSGYSAGALRQNRVIDDATIILHKPFGPDELIEAVANLVAARNGRERS